ncbi:MAG: hypothetical protein FWF41_06395 [Betaproteobacteria bacterium]|nr:hypothetical protein [Betaproteobacteria bacterium]
MSTTIASLILLGCVNTQLLDSNNKIIYDVKCENSVTVVYNHSNKEKLYVVKDEGSERVLRDYKTKKVIAKEKIKK